MTALSIEVVFGKRKQANAYLTGKVRHFSCNCLGLLLSQFELYNLH